MARWQEALEALVRTRGAALVGYAYLLCGDRREAEDLVQDALVKTFTRGRLGLEPTNLEGYVRRAVLTTYLDGFRRRRRWAAIRHLTGASEATGAHDVATDARLDVAAALAVLSPRERTCVVLRYYDDLTVAEIAATLALSDGAVKRYLSDGVHRLEPALGSLAGDLTSGDLPEPETIPVELTRRTR